MYISKVFINSFRCFKNTTVTFNEGLNVIIGENNAGKTTLFKALELIFNRRNSYKPNIDDFNKFINDFSKPPEIEISVILTETKEEEDVDKALVASWLTRIEFPWEAMLTYKYFLPEEHLMKYKEEIIKQKSIEDKRQVVNKFIDKYISRIYAGKTEIKNKAETEYLDKFDCQLLDAIRDAENNMLSGKSHLLKNVLNYFLDKAELDKLTTEDDKEKLTETNRKAFKGKSVPVIEDIKKRLDLSKIRSLSENTGAVSSDKIIFDGELNESDVIDALKLIIERSGFRIPLANNGLGYNNLIYMTLVLSQLEINTDVQQKGQNATIFPLLMIEEPEAHLHPALQYNFMQFLEKEKQNNKMSRQIFVSTHSTHITSATPLDSIICLQEANNNISAINIGKAFGSSEEDIGSKKYVERYLDATKANLLFSKAVILVEGISELLLLSTLAKYSLNKDLLDKPGQIDNFKSLEKKHVCVINVGGSTFKHFAKLFNNKGNNKDEDKIIRSNLLIKKVSCILDSDPTKKDKTLKSRNKNCWPFEYGIDTINYDYRKYSPVITFLETNLKNEDVGIFYRKDDGKTFEYDLVLSNYDNALFLDNIESGLKENITKISSFTQYSDELLEILDDPGLSGIIKEKSAEFTRLKPHIVAAYYLLNIEKKKAEKALELACVLKSNFENKLNKIRHSAFKPFIVPEHIKDAINWVCNENGK